MCVSCFQLHTHTHTHTHTHARTTERERGGDWGPGVCPFLYSPLFSINLPFLFSPHTHTELIQGGEGKIEKGSFAGDILCAHSDYGIPYTQN